MFVGAGTALNVTTVLAGSAVGVALGARLPQRTREVVTDALGLVTLLIAALSAASVLSPALVDAVGSSAPVLIVLGSLLIGGIVGSLLRLEERLEGVGAALQRRLSGSHHAAGQTPESAHRGDATSSAARGTHRREGDVAPVQVAAGHPVSAAALRRERFIEGFVSASLVFSIGPLTILGSLSDGLGRGIDQLALKSTLDGFAAVAFAASLGWGVAASALSVATIQGALTALGAAAGDLLPEAHIAALTAAGGLLLVGVAFRLLRLKQVAVGDLLPALIVAPLLTEAVVRFRS